MEFCDLKRQYAHLKEKIDSRISKVMEHGKFINGPEIKELEDKLANFVGVEFAIGVSSGTDALLASLIAMNIQRGDYVITTPFSFVASSSMIPFVDAKPIFVDISPETFNLDAGKLQEFLSNPISPSGRIPLEKIKSILAVDLFGQTADYDKIREIAKTYGLKIIEDGAQSFGAEYKGRKACSLGDISATSFFPSKPLGCYGDGGMVFTNDKIIAEKIKLIRKHGQSERYEHTSLGFNMRLDSLQAAVLLAKLEEFIWKEIEKRRSVAELYNQRLNGIVKTPLISEPNRSVYAQYSILVNNRDKLKDFLADSGIPTAIHYPKPLHLQPIFSGLGCKKGDFPVAEDIASRIISLPIDAYKTEEEINYISDKIKEFANGFS
nr:hypothetical protein [uncultured archaeon]AQS29480.1 hypothetical protein [uncultured archaeon]